MALAALTCTPPPAPLPPVPTAKPSATVPPPPDPEVIAAAACHEQTVSFHDWLQLIESSGWPLASSLLDGGAHLVERTGAALDEPAPVIHLTAGEAALDGVRVADVAALGAQLASLLELRRRTMEPSPFIANPRVYLAIDANVPWERVAQAIERIGSTGIERITFVFADPSKSLGEPPASTIDADIAKLRSASPTKREQILAELLAYVYQGCPSALQLIAQFGHEVAEMQQALVEQLPSALEGCRCAPDNASARALHWALFGNPRPGSGFTVTLASEPTRTISALSITKWQEAHALVIALGEAAASEKVAFAVDYPDDEPPGGDGNPKRDPNAPKPGPTPKPKPRGKPGPKAAPKPAPKP